MTLIQGITQSGLQGNSYGGATFKTAPALEAICLAARDNFGANAVRLQIQQQMLVGPGGNQYDPNYKALCDSVIGYALGLGLTTIINCQTEGFATIPRTLVLPNAGTQAFWAAFAPTWGGHPDVIFDLFNEPYAPSWGAWQQAFQALVTHVRGLGVTNTLWADASGGAQSLAGCPGLSDPAGNLAYSFHHPPAPYTAFSWAASFGDFAAAGHPVVNGEFAQTSVYNWGGQAAVTAYLAYLASAGIGQTIWCAMGDGSFSNAALQPAGWWGELIASRWQAGYTSQTLTEGDSGPAVAYLQERLNAAGASPPLAVDGSYGPLTLSALESWQAREFVTGVVDADDWAALGA